MSTDAQDIIKVSMGLAKAAADGTLSADVLDAELVAQCRALVGVVTGLADPLFGLQLDIARQVLSLGGLTADELAEWQAVLRARQSDQDGSPGQLPADP